MLMNTKKPKVTVLMPVYNGSLYISEAITSILTQTWDDFEFIILDDGSTDGTREIIRYYQNKDKRIVFECFNKNRGISFVANEGIKLAKGEYIVRMDHDDVSLPDRLAAEVEFMDNHPEISICGALMQTIGQEGHVWRYPEDHDLIYARMIFSNPIAHPSTILRTETLRKNALCYDENFIFGAEDYDFWSRAIVFTRFYNLQKLLVRYRIHAHNTSSKNPAKTQNELHVIHQRLLDRLGVEYSERDLLLHQWLATKKYAKALYPSSETHCWLKKLLDANEKSGLINSEIFKIEIDSYLE